MQGNTHRAGGMLCSIIGFSILQHKGLLLPDVNEGLQWLVMYPFCMWGSTASDLDHNWESCPGKTYLDFGVNKLLHLTAPLERVSESSGGVVHKVSKLLNAHHRSWQTHSDLTLGIMLWLLYMLSNGKIQGFGVVDTALLSLVLMGICLGVIAHFILDMLTPEGIWLVGIATINRLANLHFPEKLHLVPKSKLFATGGSWESFVNKVLKICTVIAIVWMLFRLVYPYIADFIPYTISLDL